MRVHPPIKKGPFRHRWDDVIRDMERDRQNGLTAQESHDALAEAGRTNLHIADFRFRLMEVVRDRGCDAPDFESWLYQGSRRIRVDDAIEDLEWMMRAGENPERAFQRLVNAGTYSATPVALRRAIQRYAPDRTDLAAYLRRAIDPALAEDDEE